MKRVSDNGARPWYDDGLRFECVPDCGQCCVNHDDYAYVYLEDGDAEALAAHLGIDDSEFRSRYTVREDGRTALRMDAPHCVFLDGRRCGVYEARPTQCRTFPFWRENLSSRRVWKRLRRFCPGIDRGAVHHAGTIRIEAARRTVE